MSCPSRTPGRPPTPGQRAQLVQLLEAGALSRDTAAAPHHPAMHGYNAVIIGALRDRGEAESRSVRRNRRSWTEYWLTEKGAELARQIKTGLT